METKYKSPKIVGRKIGSVYRLKSGPRLQYNAFGVTTHYYGLMGQPKNPSYSKITVGYFQIKVLF